jgi:hypothetical protein
VASIAPWIALVAFLGTSLASMVADLGWVALAALRVMR